MIENDRKAFNEIFDIVGEMTIMPNGKDLERMKKVLFFGLMEYPLNVITEAAKSHCRISRFFPMLADIIVQIEGTFEDRAALAWSLIMKAKHKYRRNKTLRFPSPAIHYAIECMGGWEHLYMSIDDVSENFKAKEFIRFYRLGEKNATWENVKPYFLSDQEAYALKKGREITPVIYAVESDKILVALPESDKY